MAVGCEIVSLARISASRVTKDHCGRLYEKIWYDLNSPSVVLEIIYDLLSNCIDPDRVSRRCPCLRDTLVPGPELEYLRGDHGIRQYL